MDSMQRHTGLDGAEHGFAPAAGSRAAAGNAPAFHFDVVRSVKLYPRVAVAVATVVFVGVAMYAMTRKPMYKAESLTYVEPLATKVVSDGSQGIYDPARYESYLQQQIVTAQRQDILEDAVKGMPPGTWQMPGETVADAAARLGGALKIMREGSSYQISISALDVNPERAATIVNAVTNAYLTKGKQDENAQSDGRLTLLQEESKRIHDELDADRTEQATLSKTLGVADPAGTSGNPYDLQLAGVRTELTAAREAHDVAEAQLESVTANNAGGDAGRKAVADEAIAGDSGLSALKASINQRRAQLSGQMAGLTPSNPVYKQDQEELASLDKQIESRQNTLRSAAEQRLEDKLRLELRRTGDVESRLNAQLAHDVGMASSAAPKLQRASELASEITRLQARYATVDDAIRGMKLESSGPGTAHLAVAATVPTAPESNKRNLMLALALPLALLLGAAAAVVARKRDTHVYTSGDVEAELGVAPLCVLPLEYEVSESVMGEYLLRMAAGIERAYRLNGARSFVFTAASETSEIEAFVDGVCAKLVSMGFAALALHAADVLRYDGEENQSVNSWHQGAEGEMRARYGRNDGVAMTRLEALKQENDLVLIAASPLLHAAATEYASSTADATFVVIESAVTTRSELKRCMLLLRRLKARGVGTVLDKLQSKFGESEFRATIEVMENRALRPVRLVDEVRIREDEETRRRRMLEPEPVTESAEVVRLRELAKRQQEALKAVAQFVDAAAEEKMAPAVADEALRFEEEFESPRIVEYAPAPIQLAAEVPAAEALVADEPADSMVDAVVASPVVAIATPAVAEESATDLVRKAMIERVRAKFYPVATAVEPVAVAEPVAAEAAVVSAAVVEAPIEEVATAVEAAPVVAAAVVAQPARMLAWGANIRPQQQKTVLPAEVPAPASETITAETVVTVPVVEAPVVVASTEAPAASQAPIVVAEPVVDAVVEPAAVETPWRVDLLDKPSRPAVVAVEPRPERRSRPRIAAFPQGLSKALYAMSNQQTRPSAALQGPRLTAAEEAIARLSESSHERRAAKMPPAEPVAMAQPARPAANPRRWAMLSRFDAPLSSEETVDVA